MDLLLYFFCIISIMIKHICAFFRFFFLTLLQLLLLPQIITMPTLPLPTIRSLQRQPRITSPTNHLITSKLLGQNLQRRLNNATPQSKDQMQGRLLLDVVVGESSAVFELFAGEDPH